MTSLLAVLSSADRFRASPESERRAAGVEIARRLGRRFHASGEVAGGLGLPVIRDAKAQIELIAVPGGPLRMGLSEEDDDRVAQLVHPDDPASREVVLPLRRHARPAHDVLVKPFLCARVVVTRGLASRVLGGFTEEGSPLWGYGSKAPGAPVDLRPEEAARLVRALGSRLPSEAELEHVAREGAAAPWMRGAAAKWHEVFDDPEGDLLDASAAEDGPHPFGIEMLDLGEWAADGWHESYEGAPGTSAPWEPRAAPEVVRGAAARTFPWQHPSEILRAHPACRDNAARYPRGACARLALDLPLDA